MPIYPAETTTYLDRTFIVPEESVNEIESLYNTSTAIVPYFVPENHYFKIMYECENHYYEVSVIRPYGTMPEDMLLFFDPPPNQYVVNENDIFYIYHSH